VPHERNPRTHSSAQVAQIAASIAAFGFNNPILVDTKSGIIAGHGRLLAARQLGLEQVPVIVLDHLSEAQKRAYIIANNQLALQAGWDEELLRIELSTLRAEDLTSTSSVWTMKNSLDFLTTRMPKGGLLTRMQYRLSRKSLFLPPATCGSSATTSYASATLRTSFLPIRPITWTTRGTPKTSSKLGATG